MLCTTFTICYLDITYQTKAYARGFSGNKTFKNIKLRESLYHSPTAHNLWYTTCHFIILSIHKLQ
jgi:hypothetical protein